MFSKHGQKIETEQDKQGIKECLDTLWEKIQERFHKVAVAFRYFDINNNQQISLNEFEVSLHRLGIKLPAAKIKQMFEYIDTDKDGQIQYTEFCELCEESRRGIDPYVIEKKLKQANSEQKAISHKSDKSSSRFNRKLRFDDDDEIISQSLASFKKKIKQKVKWPNNLNSSFTFGTKSPTPDSILEVMRYDPLNQYVDSCKQRENKMAQIKTEKSIFKKARPTKSSLVRDKELENQRAARRHEFLSKDVGYIELSKLKNQNNGNKSNLLIY